MVTLHTNPSSQTGAARRRHQDPAVGQRGYLVVELMVGIAILLAVVMPICFSVLIDQKMARANYYRATAIAIVDGEMEILAAGEWKAHPPGTNDYVVKAESARNLPAGKFVLARSQDRLRLEWMPRAPAAGGPVRREITLHEH